MASYFRSIFGSGNSSHHQSSSQTQSSSKSHSRSRSSPTNYIYAPSGTTPSAGSAASTLRPGSKRSNSYSARTTTPSPLRFATYDQNSAPSQAVHGRHHQQDRSPMYRRASYKTSEHSNYPIYAPSVSFSSSRSNSSSSLYPGSHHSAAAATPRSSSNSRTYPSDARPPFKQNHTWHGSHAGSTGSVQSFTPANPYANYYRPPATLHMHPLFASTRIRNAPISYDVLYTPSSRTVLDRTTRVAVPSHTLSQPATDPPTPSSARIVLRSDKFPWPVVVGSASSSSGSRFYIASGSSSSSKASNGPISNLDVLYALHSTLMTRVTPDEWEQLGHGSRSQRKVTRAYEKRCTRMGGGWEGGVRRIDWLHSKTRLVGIEVDKHGQNGGMGRLVFGKA